MGALGRARRLLIGSVVILIAIGVVMIYSASAISASEWMGDSLYYLKRHLLYLLAGGFLVYKASRADLEALRAWAKPVLIAAIVLLALVLVPGLGHSMHGARRWFKLGGFGFQPSEFLKLAIIFYMADFLDRRRDSLGDLKRTVVPALVVLGISAGLIFKQPDFGAAVTVGCVVFILFFVAGFRIAHLGALAALAAPVVIAAILAKPYRLKRLLAFVQPWKDPRGIGYQIIQSFLALGSGGLFGVGLGKSQQKLFYLPMAHTDFIFSVIGEELGFVGAGSVLILFVVFLFAGMVIVFRSRTFFAQLLSMGLVSLIGFQAFINIGVSIGALPTKGLSLPFISYGGSALLVNMLALGLLVRLSHDAEPPP